MSPLVSIIIPCHNAAPWLADALESALAQTWAEKEIILIDDGSTDDSRNVAENYHGRGVQIHSQPQSGQSAACNHGLRLARGSLIKFFDADDVLSPDAVRLQTDALTGRPSHIAYGEWARFHSEVEEAVFTQRPGWHDATPVDWLVETWADGQPMMQCAQFLIPRDLLDRTGGWDERLSLINDTELFTRLVLGSQGVVFTPGARLYYRSGTPGTVSSSRTAKAWNSAFQSLSLAAEYLLAAENSPRTRQVSAVMLQELVYAMYPDSPDLVAELEKRIAGLGGCDLIPQGGNGFQVARRLLGWKVARWLQLWAGRYPRPLAR